MSKKNIISIVLVLLPFAIDILYQLFPFYPMLFDDSRFFPQRFIIAGFFIFYVMLAFYFLHVIFSSVRFSVLQQFIRKHIFHFIVIFVFNLPTSFFVTFVFCNGFFDTSRPTEHLATIVEKTEKSHRKRWDRRVSIKSWTDGNETMEFRVSDKLYNGLNRGDAVRVFTKRGFLWIEWVDEVSRPE